MPLKPVLKYGVIAAEGIQEEDLPNELTTRVCDVRECKNYKGLSKCNRCRTAMYCSKECQKADWPHHKPYCTMVKNFPPEKDPQTGGEPPLQRHLRLWTARFNGSLVCAAIVALDLNNHPENIDDFGIVVTLHPRPHKEAGARFQFISAVVTPMAEMVVKFIMALGGAEHGKTLLKMHQQHRDELKARTNGMEDYATMIVIATNTGEHALPGGLATEIRFKPLGIHKNFVRSAQLNDQSLDWYSNLKIQVNRDIPNQALVG
ncbi:hypothetical protein MVEN_02283800 [Mycena venus]|uniref:MYND-type domain-containing protein n=1 Tax=Mycena venus TaxID=2733690 RepID=A0A8H7CEQ7_9AGAR|nr:hypothetical protein MVEN_02283800 [Mycena venus]